MEAGQACTAADFWRTGSPAWAWFCVRSQPKREHVAATHLRRVPEIEVFLPRIRFRRPTGRGVCWVTEPLFPGYLFARFDGLLWLRRVRHAPGVAGVVHFGSQWPTVPQSVIDQLRGSLGPDEIRDISGPFRVGDVAEVICGPFRGLEGILTRMLPARKRVEILLDFLGRQIPVQIPFDEIRISADLRARLE
ncbi:MAG: transcription termination/antitermination NusG family protein [Verrucomicrobiota bacterium]|nr:hypothetical protein [Limisphaera sp.]MDW8380520.1 transcription termination/antitermination NusG family protein [Verrucomicrobiota bacterium]